MRGEFPTSGEARMILEGCRQAVDALESASIVIGLIAAAVGTHRRSFNRLVTGRPRRERRRAARDRMVAGTFEICETAAEPLGIWVRHALT